MLQKVQASLRSLHPYKELEDEEVFANIERLAARLRGLRVVHLNTTSRGGWRVKQAYSVGLRAGCSKRG